jgi:hypothetical protein
VPELERFFFYGFVRGRGAVTFSYDPAERAWHDLQPTDNPASVGGVLHWGTMCYDSGRKRFVLFGGANLANERGGPGTWTYDPASNKWEELKLDRQPPPRANSQLAYDPISRRVVLFGGDRLDMLYADTWVFDGEKWEDLRPELCPPPRAGHALLWLPNAKKLLLLGGYTYLSEFSYGFMGLQRVPLEAWTYDLAANQWSLVRRWDGAEAQQAPSNCYTHAMKVAVTGDDVLALLADRYAGRDHELWLGRLNISHVDVAGTKELGVKAGIVGHRTGWCDPKWYTQGVPEPDPAEVEAELEALPANQWVRRHPPKVPPANMDWGSAVYLAKHDVIARFSGGHCAYSGTAPTVYHISTNRYSIPFAPELPINWNRADNGLPFPTWTFKVNPWMGSHTYKHTAADGRGEKLVYIRSGYTWLFDPAQGVWSRSEDPYPFRHSEFLTTLCTTPKGVAAWTPPPRGGYNGGEIWLLEPGKETWMRLPVDGGLPRMAPDQHGMAYDSKLDRLLLFSNCDGQHAGDVMAYDMKTGKARWLGAAGRDKARVMMRETIYLPEHEMVMIGARIRRADDRLLWLFYDCRKNVWSGSELGGKDNPLARGNSKVTHSVSMGLVYDSKRKLVWTTGQYSELHALRFEPDCAGLDPLQ